MEAYMKMTVSGVVMDPRSNLPVVILTNFVRYGVVPGNHINSGPGFVTKETISKVEKLAGEYR